MEGRNLQELRGDLHDLTDAITGLGIELEAINMSVRALTAHLIGEDPLRNSLYYGGPAEEGPAPEPPAWVNGGEAAGERLATAEDYPPPTRGCQGAAAAIVVLSAMVSMVTTLAVLIYLIA
jgi:hypothetical protein